MSSQSSRLREELLRNREDSSVTNNVSRSPWGVIVWGGVERRVGRCGSCPVVSRKWVWSTMALKRYKTTWSHSQILR